MGDLNTGLTQEQLSERGRKAGLKSAEVRREKKRMREWAEIIGEKEVTITNTQGVEETMPCDMAVVASMYRKAINEQDVRAAEFIAKLKGENEPTKVDVTTGGQSFRGFASVLPIVPGIEEICAKIDAERERNGEVE